MLVSSIGCGIGRMLRLCNIDCKRDGCCFFLCMASLEL